MVQASVVARNFSGHQANKDHYAVITDVPAVKPLDGNWNNANMRTWVQDPENLCYTYVNVARLGLAQLKQGRRNADTYTIFALCLRFEALGNSGTYQYHLERRSNLPEVIARTIDEDRAG